MSQFEAGFLRRCFKNMWFHVAWLSPWRSCVCTVAIKNMKAAQDTTAHSRLCQGGAWCSISSYHCCDGVRGKGLILPFLQGTAGTEGPQERGLPGRGWSDLQPGTVGPQQEAGLPGLCFLGVERAELGCRADPLWVSVALLISGLTKWCLMRPGQKGMSVCLDRRLPARIQILSLLFPGPQQVIACFAWHFSPGKTIVPTCVTVKWTERRSAELGKACGGFGPQWRGDVSIHPGQGPI